MGSQANVRSIDSLPALNAAAEQAAAGCRRMIRDGAERIAQAEKCKTKPMAHSGAPDNRNKRMCGTKPMAPSGAPDNRDTQMRS